MTPPRPRRILVGFADSRLWSSARRLARQGATMDAYDRINILNEYDLDRTFRHRYRDRLRLGSRGFGYWVWKPEVLRQVMASCEEGDLIHYVDVGCHLNPGGRDRLESYFALVERAPSGVLAFELRLPLGHDASRWHGQLPEDLCERCWTKGDLLDHFGVRDRPDIVESPQVTATHVLLRCSAPARALLDAWAAVWATDFALADDSPSRSANLRGFIDHRHDQSAFSIVAKLAQVCLLSAVEQEYPSGDGQWDWAALAAFPVHARRDLQPSRMGLRRARWRAAGYAAMEKLGGLIRPFQSPNT